MRRFDREFQRANDRRLAELQKKRLRDVSFDATVLAAAEKELDDLEMPTLRALDVYYEKRMAELDRIREAMEAILGPYFFREAFLELLRVRMASLSSSVVEGETP